MGIKIGLKYGKYLILIGIFLAVMFISVPFCTAKPAGEVVRVGITDNNFQNVLRRNVVIYGTAPCNICDKNTGKTLLRVEKDTDIRVTNDISGMFISSPGASGVIRDFVVICPSGLLGIRDLKRKGKQALYHGAFEFTQSRDRNGFYLINLIEIQDYLKGVVPNEMPVKFGLEALKAQAVAARNYVLTPRTQAYDEFDVVDSVSSQVYFGANTEDDLATRAVMETDGIVALYNNELILTLYSSTAGGYTESYSYAFSDPKTKMFPSFGKHYLSAVPDSPDFGRLDTEEKASEFYKSKVPSYDIESPYYRWQKEWAVGELENVLKKTLVAQSKTGFITPAFREGDELGKIKDIKAMRRGVSGKIIELDIMTTRGCYRISKELVIRRVFQKDGVSLPSANAIFEKKCDSYGNVTDITVYGGGFGHGVGMSQFGAGYMATKLNQPYYNILRHYYTGISLGTKPVDVSVEEVEQSFWAPVGRAKIVILGNPGSELDISINGRKHKLVLAGGFFQKKFVFDVSRYIEDGENKIVYYPANSSYKVYTELVERFMSSEYDTEKALEE